MDCSKIMIRGRGGSLSPLDPKAVLRARRKPFLKAFDAYRSAVSYGIVAEDEFQHRAILIWYKALLDVTETMVLDVFDQAPEEIRRYL